MNATQTTYRIEFTVERRGTASRRSVEGANLDKLMAKVEKLDGFSLVVSKLAA